MTPAERLAGGIDTFIDAVGRITAWSSFALALVMGTNVLLRYGFSTGSVWAQELKWHLMSPICLFGMSYALRHGEHVRVDVADVAKTVRIAVLAKVAEPVRTEQAEITQLARLIPELLEPQRSL